MFLGFPMIAKKILWLRSGLWLHFGIIVCVLFEILNTSSSSSAAASSVLLRGVGPLDDNYYMGLLSSSSASLRCKDGSKYFSKSQFNDDFCDCPDASDEPGTSACPNGKFYCKNSGHVPIYLYSSRVNDGICDCCDGSDEYDGQVNCSNTCWEAGKVARDKLKKKIATYEEGVTIRKQQVEKAKVAIAKEEAELSKLKIEEKILRRLVQQLKERKEQIEMVEEKERLQNEKEEKAKKEADEDNLKEKQIDDEAQISEEDVVKLGNEAKIGLLEGTPSQEVQGHHDNPEIEPLHHHPTAEEEYPDDNVEPVDTEYVQASKKDEEYMVEGPDTDADAHAHADADAGGPGPGHLEKEVGNAESLSKEELGRLVASRWTGEKTNEESKGVSPSPDENHENQEDNSYEEEDNAYDSEDDDHGYDHDSGDIEDPTDDFAVEDLDGSNTLDKSESDDDFDLSDMIMTAKSSWLEKIHKTVRSIFQAVNLFQTPVDKSEAARVRKEYEESNAKLSKLQAKISSLSQKLKHDFGPEKEFYSFYGQCFESKQNKYVYRLCPYKQASQVEGHSTTRLGTWEKFEDSYRLMEFLNGDKCWNGPDRSMKVKLRCGLNNEVTDVDEPSRCEYLALLSTPAVCDEEKLKELQDKVDAMSKEEARGHDEL